MADFPLPAAPPEVAGQLEASHRQLLAYARDLREVHVQLQRAILGTLEGLANALEAKDPYTRGHSDRVGRLAQRFARRLGRPPAEADLLARAGRLHDLGKIGVPEAVLTKPGPLTREEWTVMQSHAEAGARIVAPLHFLSDCLPWIRHHHEHYDGRGYPDSLAGEGIPLGAQILSVVDVFDALTTDRPYRPRLAVAAALELMETLAGRQFNPTLLRPFRAMVEADAGRTPFV